jgi:hypothetical protein
MFNVKIYIHTYFGEKKIQLSNERPINVVVVRHEILYSAAYTK